MSDSGGKALRPIADARLSFLRLLARLWLLALVLASAGAARAQYATSAVPFGSPLDPTLSGTVLQTTGNTQPVVAGQSQGQGPLQTDATPLYQPPSISDPDAALKAIAAARATNSNGPLDLDAINARQPPAPGEFESWVQDVTGRALKRYGADLLLPAARDFAASANSTIPPDYALNIGDTVSIAITGSMEGSVDLTIDRDGKIFLPRVGEITLIGTRFRDLHDRIAAAIGRVYRGYEVTVSVRQLRGVRVYVTGFAANPGAYTVNSLSTLVNAVLQAGGPSAGGSFRTIKLYRNGREAADFDLYQLLRKGDRSLDPLVQNEDVLFIPPVGQQIAVIGSVNEEAIYEARPGESLEQVLALAGGPTNVADPTRLILYRLSDQDTVGSRQIARADAGGEPVAAGDILQVLPQGTLARPLERQQVVVRLEGEVNRPGNYFVAPGTSLGQVVALAGGLTPRAYAYGTQLSRVTVRAQQRRSFLEALDQMETTVALAPLTSDRGTGTAGRQAELASARDFIARLRSREPDGRLVLDIAPEAAAPPADLLLENSDRIVVPPLVDVVGVFGAVYRPASFLLGNSRKRVRDYVEQAGGTIRGADRANVFVVRANGSVLTRRRGAMNARILPGDSVFVPIRVQSTSLLAKIATIAQIVFQFGITAAAVDALK